MSVKGKAARSGRPWWAERRLLVWLHRWTGLSIGLFLVVASLTGCVLAFQHELDDWLTPELHLARPAHLPMLDGFALRDRVRQQLAPQATVDAVRFHATPGHTLRFPVRALDDPRTGQPYPLDFNEVFVNPGTGELQGRRQAGELCAQAACVMPFVLRLHHSLALPDPWGTIVLGLASLLWTLDCLVGLYLTTPRRAPGKPFMLRWKPAWLVRWHAPAIRLNLDVHRAAGLWLWAMLLVFAWSSVMFTLREPVFRPVMGLALPFDDSWRSVPMRDTPLVTPRLDGPAALQAARTVMQALAHQHDLRIDFEDQMWFDPARGVYAYMVHSSADLRSDAGNTAILIDADTGELRGHWLPTQGALGNTVSNWLGALHMGHVFGLPYRVVIFVIGIVVVVLTVTGTVVWHQRRQARRAALAARCR